jgi:hypothetical protein
VAGGAGPLLGTLTVTLDGGEATFTNLADNTAELISLTFLGGGLSAGPSSVDVNPGPAAKLVMSTQPSATAVAGQAFGTQPVVYEEDQYGNVESADNTTVVTASLASGAGPLEGSRAVTLAAGVARFTNLGDSSPETITLKFTGGSLTSPLTSAIQVAPVTPPNPTPVVLGATIVMTPKTKKKKGAFSGFKIQFSIPMNQTSVMAAANYQLLATIKGTKAKSVGFTASYDSSTNSVTLKVSGKNPFAKGGTLTIVSSPPSGVSSQAGVFLGSGTVAFRISNNAKSITGS